MQHRFILNLICHFIVPAYLVQSDPLESQSTWVSPDLNNSATSADVASSLFTPNSTTLMSTFKLHWSQHISLGDPFPPMQELVCAFLLSPATNPCENLSSDPRRATFTQGALADGLC